MLTDATRRSLLTRTNAKLVFSRAHYQAAVRKSLEFTERFTFTERFMGELVVSCSYFGTTRD